MRRKWLCCPVLIGLLIWLLWANVAVELNEWQITSPELPHGFAGFRIAQVSDLHNTAHWEAAVERLAEAQPDIIVLTGDLVDSRDTDVDRALDFVREAVEIAPCYYVTGNHESRIRDWPRLRQGLLDAGVRVLENDSAVLERNGETITLLGLMDPDFGTDPAGTLEMLTEGEEGYTILLSHRPELMELYAQHGVDLVFSGHAHGGQVRIPFVGGLVAPHQGFFPQYDAGLYRQNGTAMLVSRGVGNSIIPLRINNRPEVIVAVFGTGFFGEI